MLNIRKAEDDDFDGIWSIFREIVIQGETYAFPPDTNKADARKIWMLTPTATYVALKHGEIVGTYYLKPNQPGLGSHVCNAGYMVRSHVRGQGVGRAMCEHSLVEAKNLGFKAMQFNLVVKTNENAIRLWKKMGFFSVGTLPKAFMHKKLGLIDAIVMYKLLDCEI